MNGFLLVEIPGTQNYMQLVNVVFIFKKIKVDDRKKYKRFKPMCTLTFTHTNKQTHTNTHTHTHTHTHILICHIGKIAEV